MSRVLSTVISTLLVFVFFVSLFEACLYAGEQNYFERHKLEFTRGWLFYFKWAVKSLSLVASLVFMIIYTCTCCCGPNRRNNRGFLCVLAFVSLALSLTWVVIVQHQLRSDKLSMFPTTTDSKSLFQRMFLHSLSEGFSFKNSCDAPPFTLADEGVTACKILMVESGGNIGCMVAWFLTFVLSIFAIFSSSSRRREQTDAKFFEITNHSSHN
ncbi:hypothetical protein GGI12_000436 [Dipsacomyces acuminosporus]|nr:hypothetical protein GGI12_000436 [Dipsacomyces acuminosporus]